MDETQKVQESEYQFPYHYLPEADGGQFTWWPNWSWGYKYLTGIEVVLGELKGRQCNSLIDVGCGDGRFLREVAKAGVKASLLGVDYSERAIRIAQSLNPGIEYRSLDITSSDLHQSFDVVTLVEVLEHIPTDSINGFVEGLSRLMHEHSILIVTVPHKNEPVIAKHYQHFDSASLKKIFDNYFTVEKMFFFDNQSRVVSMVQRLLFNKYYVIRHQGLLNYAYRKYRENYLHCAESDCSRIGVVLKKK
jgi:SAM-dependent methyltransferase